MTNMIIPGGESEIREVVNHREFSVICLKANKYNFL